MDNNTNSKDLVSFVERIEYMLLFQLTTNIKSGRLSIDEAQKIAKAYASFKPTSKEELLQSLIDLGRTYIVIEPVIATFTEEYDNDFKKDVLEKMNTKLTHGDMDGAIEEGKRGGLAA